MFVVLATFWLRSTLRGLWIKQFESQVEVLNNALVDEIDDRVMLLEEWSQDAVPQRIPSADRPLFTRSARYFRKSEAYLRKEVGTLDHAARISFFQDGADKILALDRCGSPDPRRSLALCISTESILNLQPYVRSDPSMRSFRFDLVDAQSGRTLLEMFPFNPPFERAAQYPDRVLSYGSSNVGSVNMRGEEYFFSVKRLTADTNHTVVAMAPLQLFRAKTREQEIFYLSMIVLLNALLFAFHYGFFKRNVLLPALEVREYEEKIHDELGVRPLSERPSEEFHIIRDSFEDLHAMVKAFKDRKSQNEKFLKEEIARLDSERQEAVAQLVQTEKMAVMSRLMAGVAHEIRNPLAAIELTLGNMRLKSPDMPDSIRSHVEIISEEIQRLSGILNRFLGLGKKHVSSTFERKNVNDIVGQVVKLMAPVLAEKSIDLEVSLDPSMPESGWIYDEIFGALVNVLKNALEATPEGGRVRILTACSGGAIVVKVEDSGAGIPEGDREKIFDVFFTTKPNGSGLGLPQVLQAVSLHRGRIVVSTSALGGASIEMIFHPEEEG